MPLRLNSFRGMTLTMPMNSAVRPAICNSRLAQFEKPVRTLNCAHALKVGVSRVKTDEDAAGFHSQMVTRSFMVG